MNHEISRKVAAIRHSAGSDLPTEEMVAEETPVALAYNLKPHAVMMATPADLDDFALGFSLTEGIVENAGEIELVDRIHADRGISLQMLIPQRHADRLTQRERNLTGRTGCGLCGASTLDAAIRTVAKVTAKAGDPAIFAQMFAALESGQALNRQTGAVHAAALIVDDGAMLVREDVGRHNAVDKVFGACARQGSVPRALYVTSRASYEIVHKAAQMNCPLVGAISAPTAFAIRLAAEAGITLAGFARPPRFTVYSG